MTDTASAVTDQVPTVAHVERVMARSIRELWGVNNSHAIAQTTFRALNEAGYVIVPREPTAAMTEAAVGARDHGCWQAMIAAALR